MCSVDDVEASVWLQRLGNANAFGRLVVIEQGSHDTGQGKCRAVKGVAELGLLRVAAAVAALQTVGPIDIGDGCQCDRRVASASYWFKDNVFAAWNRNADVQTANYKFMCTM